MRHRQCLLDKPWTNKINGNSKKIARSQKSFLFVTNQQRYFQLQVNLTCNYLMYRHLWNVCWRVYISRMLFTNKRRITRIYCRSFWSSLFFFCTKLWVQAHITPLMIVMCLRLLCAVMFRNFRAIECIKALASL